MQLTLQATPTYRCQIVGGSRNRRESASYYVFMNYDVGI